MLLLSASLLNQPVLSLRTGGTVAIAQTPIINPNNMKIEGFYCQDSRSGQQLVLVSQDIRDIIKQGFVVNDFDVLAEPEDLVRLEDVMKIRFDLMGKPVVTVSKDKVGKVNDYAADQETLYIQKLYVGQSLLKSLGGGQLSVDRSQIVEITNKKIIVQDLVQLNKAGMPAGVPAS